MISAVLLKREFGSWQVHFWAIEASLRSFRMIDRSSMMMPNE